MWNLYMYISNIYNIYVYIWGEGDIVYGDIASIWEEVLLA